MKFEDYLEQFDVTDKEIDLQILLCGPKPISATENVHWMYPKQLLNNTFKEQSFHLALCANFLFIDPMLSETGHLETLLELVRISSEVRIAPLLDPEGQPSVHLGPILQALQQKGYGVELREIKASQKSQKQALLRVWNPSCALSNRSRRSPERPNF